MELQNEPLKEFQIYGDFDWAGSSFSAVFKPFKSCTSVYLLIMQQNQCGFFFPFISTVKLSSWIHFIITSSRKTTDSRQSNMSRCSWWHWSLLGQCSAFLFSELVTRFEVTKIFHLVSLSKTLPPFAVWDMIFFLESAENFACQIPSVTGIQDIYLLLSCSNSL